MRDERGKALGRSRYKKVTRRWDASNSEYRNAKGPASSGGAEYGRTEARSKAWRGQEAREEDEKVGNDGDKKGRVAKP